jgi:hypothetical protein
MQLRRPSFPEIMIQFVCLLLLGLHIFDYFDALSASPCSIPQPTRNCYPWGGEGPVAGVWTYSSKDAYLRTAMWRIAFLALAPIAPFFARGPGGGVLAAVALAAAGIGSDETFARAF